MKKLFAHLFIITIVALVNKAYAQQAGVLDSTFNQTGSNIIINSANNANSAFAVAIQADGKAVVAGYIQYSSDTQKVLVDRFKTDGTLDSTFNGTGIFYFLAGRTSEGEAVAIQSDGKIVVGGSAFISGDQNDFLLLRLNTNGALDSTFGVNGVTTLDFTDGQQDRINSLAIQPNGKIIVGGSAFANGNYNFALARYNTDGSFDITFGQDSRVLTPIGVGASIANDIALQADGKILLGGYSVNSDSILVSTICRYTAKGVIDSTFNSTGIVITKMSAFDNQVYALAVQPDGKIVTSGYANNANNYGDFALARYNTNGTPDNTFNGNGKVLTDFNGNDDNAYTVTIQPDGKIIACGYSFINADVIEFAMARYNSNGTPDNSFGNSGLAGTSLGNNDDEIYAATLQPDGKLVVAGISANFTNANLTVARYLTSPSTGVLNFNTPVNQYLIYPNPATENTQLEYELQNTETITVQVFDITGKLISTVLNSQTQTAGKHNLTIHFGNQLAAGTYFVRIMGNNGQVSVKMVKG